MNCTVQIKTNRIYNNNAIVPNYLTKLIIDKSKTIFFFFKKFQKKKKKKKKKNRTEALNDQS